MPNLTFEQPIWYLALCLLAGLLVAGILYYRSPLDAPRPLVWLMAILRFVGYSLLAALLLSPLLRYLSTEREEPIVVMAQDVSESVGLQTDTTAYVSEWEALRDALAGQYEVVSYTFGGSVRRDGPLTFADKKTNLDAVLTEIADLYGNRNLGAVVLATDGIYNEGTNPVYRDLPLSAPIYTVGLGDTTRRRDLVVSRVFHNRVAYLGDQFTIQVDIRARNASSEATTLTVSRVGEGGNTVLHTERVAIEGPDFFTTREVTLDADRAGVQRYRIAVTGISGELSTANNQRDIFVDVLDARQKILILAAAPHPDLGALRQSLAGAKNNEVDVAYGERFVGEVDDYDLVILHELPTATVRLSQVMEALQRQNKPVLFITGPSLPAPIINGAQDLVRWAGSQVRGNEVTAELVASFSAFTLSEELRRALPTYPPLTAPFGQVDVSPGASVMLRQRIGRVETDFPLLVVGQSRGARTGVLLASGLWQWRLYDYLEYGDHGRFDELVGQLAQYLTVQEDKRRFRVSVAENIFDENEPVRLDAELYNSSYELINGPEATVVITGQEGREYDYTFTRTATAYTLDAGTLPPGNYRFRAVTDDGGGGEALVSEGRFSVQSVELERYALEADHALLRQLSDRYGGALLLPGQLEGLPAQLEASGGVKPLLFQTVNTRSILNFPALFFLLLALLAGEWGLRRWAGGY